MERSRVYPDAKQGLQAGAAAALDTILDEEKQKQPWQNQEKLNEDLKEKLYLTDRRDIRLKAIK